MPQRLLTNQSLKSVLQRKQARNCLFQRNRAYLHLQMSIQQTQMIEHTMNFEGVQAQPTLIDSQFSTIINAFPTSAFQLRQLPKLIRLLNSTLLIEQCKSVLGLDFLASFFTVPQVRLEIFSENAIQKLMCLLKSDCSLVRWKSISLLRKLSSSVNGQQEFDIFVNWRKVQFMLVLELLTCNYSQIRKESLLFIHSLVIHNFTFEDTSHKLKMLQKLKQFIQIMPTQSLINDFQVIFCLLDKTGLNFRNQQSNQVQMVCQIAMMMIQKLKNTKLEKYVLSKVTMFITLPKLLTQFNEILSKKSYSEFQSLFPKFASLLQLLFFKQLLVNGQLITLFEQNQLTKLLSKKHIYAFFVHLRILQKIRFSLFTESALHHSQGWSVAISCLTLIQKLFQKKYKSFVDWFAKDHQFFVKLQELYGIHHEYLHRQLNSTLNSMIKANPLNLIYSLKQHGLIRQYFQSIGSYGKNTAKVALSSMKKSVQSLRKDPFCLQNLKLQAFIKQQASQVEFKRQLESQRQLQIRSSSNNFLMPEQMNV